MVISHHRWFLDRIATHIRAAEVESQRAFFDGNYEIRSRQEEAPERGGCQAEAHTLQGPQIDVALRHCIHVHLERRFCLPAAKPQVPGTLVQTQYSTAHKEIKPANLAAVSGMEVVNPISEPRPGDTLAVHSHPGIESAIVLRFPKPWRVPPRTAVAKPDTPLHAHLG